MTTSAPVDWELSTEHAGWAPRDSCGEVSFADRMWLLGGWFDSHSIGPRDVWASDDGAEWVEVTTQAGWRHGDLPTSLAFKDRMWMMGGWYAGRVAEGGPGNEVWSSADGVNWDCATERAAWSPRLGAAGGVTEAMAVRGRFNLQDNVFADFDEAGSVALGLHLDRLGQAPGNLYRGNVFERCQTPVAEEQPGLWDAGNARGR
ncbi:MAG TPA: hypothetical protein VM283_05125 [Armatimonadota bacterium]|nr:hypothetical protein [Armatimonadota bacterium]